MGEPRFRNALNGAALFRHPHEHTPADSPDKVDYDPLARAVSGLKQVIRG